MCRKADSRKLTLDVQSRYTGRFTTNAPKPRSCGGVPALSHTGGVAKTGSVPVREMPSGRNLPDVSTTRI